MSADILTFPGEGLPDRPITQGEIDKLHSKNFRDLEGRISDCVTMSAIAMDVVIPAIIGADTKHEKAQFAICQLSQMLKKMQTDYYAAWHSETELDRE
jgi:hypothetical protein